MLRIFSWPDLLWHSAPVLNRKPHQNLAISVVRMSFRLEKFGGLQPAAGAQQSAVAATFIAEERSISNFAAHPRAMLTPAAARSGKKEVERLDDGVIVRFGNRGSGSRAE